VRAVLVSLVLMGGFSVLILLRDVFYNSEDLISTIFV
jgi:hypothetical protein